MKHSQMLFAACLLILAIFPHWDTAAQERDLAITSLAWSADGSKIAVAYNDGTIQIQNANTGEITFTLQGEIDGEITRIAFSRDMNSHKLASGGVDGLVRIWDADTGDLLHSLSGNNAIITGLTWNPVNTQILASASTNGIIKIWDTSTGTVIVTSGQNMTSIFDLAWSPDATKLITGGTAIALWNANTGTFISNFAGTGSEIAAVDWGQNSDQVVSASVIGILFIWNPLTGNATHIIRGDFTNIPGSLDALAISPDGNMIATGGWDNTIRFWNMNGELIQAVSTSDAVIAITWSPDGTQLAYGSFGDTLHIIPAPQVPPIPLPSPSQDDTIPHSGVSAQENKDAIYSIAWSPDGTMIAVSGGALKCDPTDPSKFSIRIFNATTLQIAKTLTGHTCPTTGIDWSPDGSKLVSASSSESVAHIWDVATGQILVSTSPEAQGIITASWQPKGTQIASAFTGNTVITWNSITGMLNTPTEIWGTTVDWSPDGTQLVTGSGYGTDVAIFDAHSQQELNVLKGHTDGVGPVKWSPDGTKIASGSADKSIKIWNPATGTVLLTLQGHSETITDLAWHPNSMLIASSSSDKTIRFWNTANGQSLDTIQASQGVSAIAWSPDGTQLAYAVGDTLHIIPAPQVQTPDYTKQPIQLAYSPDGSMIAGSAVGLLRVWDAYTGATLIDFPTIDTTYVLDVTWSPDSKRIGTASDDQFVRIWNISDSNHAPGQLLQSIQPITKGFGDLSSVDWSPNGQFLAIGSVSEPYSLKIWDAMNYAQIRQIEAGWVERLDWNPNSDSNEIIVSDENGGTTFFSHIDTASNISSRHIGRNDPVSATAWNADGSQIAVGYQDGKIYIWDMATNTSLANMDTGIEGRIYQLAWSPDNKQLASTNGNGIVQVWDTGTGALISSLPGISASVDFSPDGTKLAYAAGAGAIQIVDAP